jgi:hypothetical protein
MTFLKWLFGGGGHAKAQIEINKLQIKVNEGNMRSIDNLIQSQNALLEMNSMLSMRIDAIEGELGIELTGESDDEPNTSIN